MLTNDFYVSCLGGLKSRSEDRFLVVCGGDRDRDALLEVGVRTAVISNLNPHRGQQDYAPYTWERQDAEDLSYSNEAFDWVVVHSGIHHCLSPHKAICEMLRVARKGILVVESRDSLFMKLSARLGLLSSYEMEAILLNDGERGGLRNGPIPNFIYRWSEHEVKKTVENAEPHLKHDYKFFYDWRIPTKRMGMSRSFLRRSASKLADRLRPVLKAILPRQGNRFGFCVRKNLGPKAWIIEEHGDYRLNLEHAKALYDPKKYSWR